jgi:hypothetical protein
MWRYGWRFTNKTKWWLLHNIAAFVASLEAAVKEGEHDGFPTTGDVEAEVQAAIDAKRPRQE